MKKVYLIYAKIPCILFDSKIVDTLLKFTAVYPSGSKVITNEGEKGIVIKQNKNFPERPIIQIIETRDGTRPQEDKIIDLIKVNNIMIDSVLD